MVQFHSTTLVAYIWYVLWKLKQIRIIWCCCAPSWWNAVLNYIFMTLNCQFVNTIICVHFNYPKMSSRVSWDLAPWLKQAPIERMSIDVQIDLGTGKNVWMRKRSILTIGILLRMKYHGFSLKNFQMFQRWEIDLQNLVWHYWLLVRIR